jgi:hypothetical protein
MMSTFNYGSQITILNKKESQRFRASVQASLKLLNFTALGHHIKSDVTAILKVKKNVNISL